MCLLIVTGSSNLLESVERSSFSFSTIFFFGLTSSKGGAVYLHPLSLT